MGVIKVVYPKRRGSFFDNFKICARLLSCFLALLLVCLFSFQHFFSMERCDFKAQLPQKWDVKILDKIGEGSFGSVYKAVDLTDESPCAVKV